MKQKFMGTEPLITVAFHSGWGKGDIPQTVLRADGGREEPDLHPQASPQGKFHADPRF